MKLFLHIGTEKTGSSFLQSYLANNRDLLLKHSIFFPHAGIQEKNMRSCKITPGNAFDLNRYLQHKDWKKTKEWLEKKYNDAEKMGCKAVLLSNEILSLTFAENDVLNNTIKLIKSIGFKLQPFLLIIREPVSQALSLYKHRSKEGLIIPINQWLNEKYILAKALIHFYKGIDENKILLAQYPYKKDSNYLVDVIINLWLGLNETIEVKYKAVNPSLSLSELNLLCAIFKGDKILAKKYYDFMLDINPIDKANDFFLENNIKITINNYMIKYNMLWQEVNNRMSVVTQPFYYEFLENENNNYNYSFSEKQIQTISQFIEYSSSLNYLLKRTLTQIKNIIILLIPDYFNELRKKLFYK